MSAVDIFHKTVVNKIGNKNMVSVPAPPHRKVILVGDAQVGKTALACALTGRSFPRAYEPTPAAEFMWVDRAHEASGETIRLQIFDCGFGGND